MSNQQAFDAIIIEGFWLVGNMRDLYASPPVTQVTDMPPSFKQMINLPPLNIVETEAAKETALPQGVRSASVTCFGRLLRMKV